MSFLFSARRSYQSRHSGICHSSWTWLNPTMGMCTNGMPSPIVQKAMLTPSLVWAYWMRGSMATLSYTIAASGGRPAHAPFDSPAAISQYVGETPPAAIPVLPPPQPEGGQHGHLGHLPQEARHRRRPRLPHDCGEGERPLHQRVRGQDLLLLRPRLQAHVRRGPAQVHRGRKARSRDEEGG